MRSHPSHDSRKSAFTLVELLVVLAIMGLLVAISLPAVRGLNGSGQFNKAVGLVAGTMTEARGYAMAQNTYVWVAFYTNAPSASSPSDLYIAAYASDDGTDPINWEAMTVGPGLPFTVNAATLSPITRLRSSRATQIAPVATTYQNPPNPSAETPSDPATAPVFQTILVGNSGRKTLSSIAVVQFLPSGGARISGSPVGAIGVGLQPLKGVGVPDTKNLATVWISGLTGSTTVYRR